MALAFRKQSREVLNYQLKQRLAHMIVTDERCRVFVVWVKLAQKSASVDFLLLIKEHGCVARVTTRPDLAN